ncbi:MAG: hypothetical protein GOV00_00190 [Candidatus Altiarchaeota archaeon]|nr:hypothetical protein [Candidatus Altiarchaeota archaeon]
MSNARGGRCTVSIGVRGRSEAIEEVLWEKDYVLGFDAGSTGFQIYLKEQNHPPTDTLYQVAATVSDLPFLAQKHAYIIDFEDLGENAHFGVSQGETESGFQKMHLTVNNKDVYENLLFALEYIEIDLVAQYLNYELNKASGPSGP